MRPKKRILVVDVDANRLCERMLVLEIGTRYRVVSATCAAEALNLLESATPLDALLCELVLDRPWTGADLCQRAAALRPELPRLLCADRLPDAAQSQHATAVWSRQSGNAATLLERLEIITAKKRGPKPFRVPRPAAELGVCA